MITHFFQGNGEDSDEMIGMERATSLSSEEVAHYQGTGMIGTATAADDEEVLVILRSMKSAVSHFVGDKKYLSAHETRNKKFTKKKNYIPIIKMFR